MYKEIERAVGKIFEILLWKISDFFQFPLQNIFLENRRPLTELKFQENNFS